MISLPDVNIWLALAIRADKHHAAASEWFGQVPQHGASFCRLTQQGFLRLATNPKAFGAATSTLPDAWRHYDALRADPRVLYSEEPEDLETFWRRYTRRRSFSPKVWNDAYLAAFAQTADYELVTFDGGFGQYQIAHCTILR